MRTYLIVPLLLAACGDNVSPAAVDAAPDAPSTGAAKAVVVAGDFQSTGVLSTVDAPSLTVTQNAVAGVASSDPVVRRIGSELFVVNRYGGDNITILDGATLALVDQIGTGANTNPQDVAQVGRKLYVAALGVGAILVIDRDHPTTVNQIDVSSFDAFDQNPDCESIYAVGDKVYAACGLLQQFSPVVNGKILVIDTSNDTVSTSFDLPSMNPAGWLEKDGGDLLIPLVPSFTDYSTGCVARVTTGTTPSASCDVSNQTLGGFALRIVDGWAIVGAYDDNFNTTKGVLVRMAGGASQSGSTEMLKDLAVCGQYLFVGDNAMSASGIRVFQATGDTATELTTAPLDIGLPPGYGDNIACATTP